MIFKRIAFFVLMVLLLVGCISTPEEAEIPKVIYKEIQMESLTGAINSVNTPGNGYIVDAFIIRTRGGINLATIEISESINEQPIEIKAHGGYYEKDYQYSQPKQFEIYESDLYKRIDKSKKYKIYIGIYYDMSYRRWYPFVDRIEGLMTLEELAAIEAAAKTAKLKAEEEANRYNPTDFAFLINNFKPGWYKKIDLFDAISNVDKMNRGDGSLDVFGNVTRYYVSDVVFESQTGIDIKFKTSDNAIFQYFKISGRSGLSNGQNVRIYYCVTKNPITEWNIEAIEYIKKEE